jgi:thiamine-monophosphate kinase
MADPAVASDIGEFELIERIRRRLPGAPEGETWSGDDAALLGPAGPAGLVFTTDVMTEDVDFDFSWSQGADVGYKALAVNASDVAAMGGRPMYAVVALSVRPDVLLATVDGIAEGLREAATHLSVALVGGDISGARQMSVAVSMIGAAPARPVKRAGARPGQAICVTGSLGGAAGGLIALRRGLAGPGPAEAPALSPKLARAVEQLATRQLRPPARVREGQRLAELGATAMIDISDGLAADLGHLLDASSVGCEVDAAAVPVDDALDQLSRALSDEDIDPFALAVAGGEDFELLFTADEARVGPIAEALDELGTKVTSIGSIAGAGRRLGHRTLEEWGRRGWDHLQRRDDQR